MTPISCPPLVTPPAAIGKELWPSLSSTTFGRLNYPLGPPALESKTRTEEASQSDWPTRS